MKFPPNHSLKKSISNESNYSIIRIKRIHQERFLKYHHLTLLNQIQDYSTQVRNHVPSTHLYASDRALKICKSRRPNILSRARTRRIKSIFEILSRLGAVEIRRPLDPSIPFFYVAYFTPLLLALTVISLALAGGIERADLLSQP